MIFKLLTVLVCSAALCTIGCGNDERFTHSHTNCKQLVYQGTEHTVCCSSVCVEKWEDNLDEDNYVSSCVKFVECPKRSCPPGLVSESNCW